MCFMLSKCKSGLEQDAPLPIHIAGCVYTGQTGQETVTVLKALITITAWCKLRGFVQPPLRGATHPPLSLNCH